MTVETSERALKAADEAHTRLLMDADAELALRDTTYDALHSVAARHKTLNVPQIAAALYLLRTREER